MIFFLFLYFSSRISQLTSSSMPIPNNLFPLSLCSVS
ncbi:hypothetical protein GLYMA_10G093851v4 [Glycine max]|nr:hypothetical protein GLYMA_10G093851v4 [Glycine max]KAH1137482.1 hypothetical protein GYH30_027467 [Glycine max]